MKIYLAHQITGLSSDQVIDYYENMKRMLEKVGFEVLQPMTAKGYFRTERDIFKPEGYLNPVSTNHAIVERDCWMVGQADIVQVDLTGTEQVSIGMVTELAWAHLLRKHTLVILPPKNIHSHAFVRECADIIFDNQSQAMEYLAKLATQEM
jgi:nucleoside 2-deoxyribosyltransferase